MYLDSGLTGLPHIDYAARKATTAAKAIASLMPRCRGTGDARRRLLATVVDSIMLYAAPIWGPHIEKRTVCQRLQRAQRTMALRLSRANRTTSTVAVQVISGQVPYDLRCRELISRGRPEEEADDEESYTREKSIQEWQRRWAAVSEGKPGYWTATLIPDIATWLSKKSGDMTYPLAQMLTGHGSFAKYLHWIGKFDSPVCQLCTSGEEDDVRHTFEACDHTATIREDFMRVSNISPPLTCKRLAEHMLVDRTGWQRVAKHCQTIIAIKDNKHDHVIIARREAAAAAAADGERSPTGHSRSPE